MSNRSWVSGENASPLQYSTQFFQVHACVSQPDFHFHPGLSVLLRISESMILFRCSKDPLYRLLPFLIELLHLWCMADIFRFLHV